MATVAQHIQQSAQSKYSHIDFTWNDTTVTPSPEMEYMGLRIMQDPIHPQFWVVRDTLGRAIAGLGGSYTPLQRAKTAIEQYIIKQQQLEEERKAIERDEQERREYEQK